MEQNEKEKQLIEGGFKIPPNMFAPTPKEEGEKGEIPAVSSQPSDLIGAVFNTAIVETVKHDDEVKGEIVDSAKDTIRNKTQAYKDNAEAEAKEAYFNNNKDACECFGFKEEKMLEKWAVKCMKVVYRVLLAVYIAIASFTLAPTIFILQRVRNAVKKTWLAIVLAVLIYTFIYFVLPYLAVKGWIK